MLVRILTSLILLAVVVFVWMFFLDTLLFNAVIWLLCALALIEIFKAAGILSWRCLTVLAVAQAFVISFMRTQFIGDFALPALFLIALGYFAALVKNFGSMKLADCSGAFLFGTLIPLFFSCAIYIRDLHGAQPGGFYLLLALGAAWLSDTSAYFVGTFLGKHKLAPKVSPKKTIEGTIGGLVLSTGLLLLLGLLYQNLVGVSVNFAVLALISPVLSMIGMLGDLSASAIKREYGVKDFGNIMPGHGGILDRFDSVLFTLPAVYVAALHIELITLL